MLIGLNSPRDWVYMLQRNRVHGINYIAETMVKFGFGKPVAGPSCPVFDGYRIFSLHSVSYTGEWLYSNRDYTEGNSKLRIEDAEAYAVDWLLNKLDTANAAGEFYNRAGMFGCTGMIIMTHEQHYEWTIKPVLDERLWKRYVDSVNRTAANVVVR